MKRIVQVIRLYTFWWEWKHPIRSVRRMCGEFVWRIKLSRMPLM
jgi:hypothetical protein